MKVLIITNEFEDYQADHVLYGLRMKLGADAVDWPRKDVMYTNGKKPVVERYGHGFTTWGLLEDIPVDREGIEDRLAAGAFDLVVFSSIHRQMDSLRSLLTSGLLARAEVRSVDGEDEGHAVRMPALALGPYFKRESSGEPRVKPISFAIPACKLRLEPLPKTRLFASHVQCPAAFQHPYINDNCSGNPESGVVGGGPRRKYAFTDEHAYYADLASSEYAITMKKGGWDCMRHYEQAANLAVQCFYQLERKPRDAAPYGLKDGLNCLSFSDAHDLARKIDRVDAAYDYERLQAASFAWVSERTCEQSADYIIEAGDPGPWGNQALTTGV